MKAAFSVVLFLSLGLVAIQAAKFIQPRIINGHNATVAQFPWVVALTGKTKSGLPVFCNGALISNKTIVTVAQCVDNVKRFSISLGSVRRDAPLVHITSHTSIVHPKYNPTTFANNVAIINLSSALSFTKAIKSVQLPLHSQRNEHFTNSIATVSGFGRVDNKGPPSSRLQFAKVKILPEKKCQSFYGTQVSTSQTMCTMGSENDLQGACPNDNGSPLVITEKLNDILIGLVSFISESGCDLGHPTGYVRVAPYTTWIRENSAR